MAVSMLKPVSAYFTPPGRPMSRYPTRNAQWVEKRGEAGGEAGVGGSAVGGLGAAGDQPRWRATVFVPRLGWRVLPLLR